jgi:hypothetical protein
MNDLELGWLAGVFEGEGTCGVYGPYEYAPARVQMVVASTDLDVIERVHALTGRGTVRRKNPKPSAVCTLPKPQYHWQVAAVSDVAAVCTLLYPLLHARRQAQMKPVMEFCANRIRQGRASGRQRSSGSQGTQGALASPSRRS